MIFYMPPPPTDYPLVYLLTFLVFGGVFMLWARLKDKGKDDDAAALMAFIIGAPILAIFLMEIFLNV